jgi:fatty acid desaturase
MFWIWIAIGYVAIATLMAVFLSFCNEYGRKSVSEDDVTFIVLCLGVIWPLTIIILVLLLANNAGQALGKRKTTKSDSGGNA